HTRFKCDWSSDVCSSDLCFAVMRVLGTEDFSQSCPRALRQPFWAQLSSGGHPGGLANRVIHFSEQFVGSAFEFRSSSWMEFRSEIGRASCRERGEVSGGV